MTITKKDHGKEIKVRKWDVIQIELETQGAAGYAWHFDALDNQFLELIKEETKDGKKNGMVGAPLTHIWQLRAIKGGETEILLHCFRVWELKDRAIDLFRIKAKIICT
ncbi:MAG: protease inhibitor I42 family protein [Deltaproteobacteria bacterium]|nr:protease inhibitor I42 family protein [Deltaproteobacteria bacterium]